MPPAARRPRHRTQDERRATTQAALLDATIECLVEYGYAGTTTNRIVDRAGVSRGAQVHYYPSKSDLMAEAVRHLAERRIDELADIPAGNRVELTIDGLWRYHHGPLYRAAVELFVAARTDPELAERLHAVEQAVTDRIGETMTAMFGSAARSRGFATDFAVVTATMRGLALIDESTTDAAAAERRWRSIRKRLIALLQAHLDGSPA